MAERPVVLCRSACLVLEDRLGNGVLAIALAAGRLLTVRTESERRRYIVMIRRQAERLEAIHRGLTPCDRCPGCPDRGRLVDEIV